VQIDADNQYTAEDIPKLVKPIIENKADMVLASRFQGGMEGMPFSKRFGNKISTFVTNKVSGAKISDSTTGFRAIRKEVLEEISPTSDFTYTQEMIIRVQKEGWRIAEIPSFFKKRKFGESRLFSSVITYARNAFLIIILTYRDYHPVKFFGIPGIILGVIGFLLGLHLLQLQFAGVNLSTRFGLIVLSAFLILSGLILVSMGIIADAIEQKFRQTKREMLSIKRMQKK
ncbi:MAG: glycosyltransferase family 2 protein, partial [Candidatus Diapherotrites archaeon]|nr:glycosyltransferase family 2 protein [Candidatus Diapherotrites archaeon]